MISKNTPLRECFLLIACFDVGKDTSFERAMEVCCLFLCKLHDTGYRCIQGIITTLTNVLSWMDLRTTLSDNDLSWTSMGPIRHFHAKALPMGITTQTGTSARFFMCHIEGYE